MAFIVRIPSLARYWPDTDFQETNVGLIPLSGGGTVETDLPVPLHARLNGAKKMPPDIFMCGYGPAVTGDFRNKVEDLEPGVHQFFPVELELKTGEKIVDRFFLMNICTVLECIDTEKTTLNFTPSKRKLPKPYGGTYNTPRLESKATKHVEERLVLKKSEIEGKCMWLDAQSKWRGGGGFYFFSDELMSFYFDTRMIGLEMAQVMES